MDSTPNPYQSPETVSEQDETGRTLGSVVYSSFTVLLLAGMSAYVFLSRKTVLRLFEDFGVELPMLTVFFIHPLVPWFFVAFAAVGCGKEFLFGNRDRLRIWNHVLIGLSVGGCALYTVGIMVPMLKIIQALENS